MHVPTIHRIRIEKFRRIQEPLELDFTSPKGQAGKTIVLAGPNGCGKTSILEAVILGLFQGYLIVRDEEKAKRQQHWRTILPEDARIEITVSFGDAGTVQSWKRTVGTVETDCGPIPSDVIENMAVEYFSSWRAPELVGAVRPLVGRGGRPIDNEANRLWRMKQRINDERARGGYQQMLPGTAKDEAWLDVLNRAWRRFHGDDGTSIDAQVVDPHDEELFADLFVVKNGKRICSVDQVSSGEIELLSFASWVIFNGVDGGLLIIDEPELHLHPQWQSAFLPALRELSPKTQFLVASHSDAVWDQAYSFERFLLIGEDDLRSRSAQLASE